eukprot:GFUD01092766.1.p1 GENE.GFUD01092766.1~~GFUD01092766.1.p1  ORF type:complete len:225 (-),score=84.49 GFUD01092766.1:150-824(-)
MDHLRLEDVEELGDLQMRSQNSRERVRVNFRNDTVNSRVRLLWLDFHGEEVDYGVLGPNESNQMNTFVTHPWVIKRVQQEEEEQEAEKEEEVFFKWPDKGKLRPVFEAQKFVEKLWQEDDDELLGEVQDFLNGQLRMNIIIRSRYTPPSLQRSALTVLTDQQGITLDTVSSLELPETLVEQLRAELLRRSVDDQVNENFNTDSEDETDQDSESDNGGEEAEVNE